MKFEITQSSKLKSLLLLLLVDLFKKKTTLDYYTIL